MRLVLKKNSLIIYQKKKMCVCNLQIIYIISTLFSIGFYEYLYFFTKIIMLHSHLSSTLLTMENYANSTDEHVHSL